MSSSLIRPTPKTALASAYRQLGYGAENGTWRNFYLTGAQELETGPQGPVLTLDVVQSTMALELNQLMVTMAVKLNGSAAQGLGFSVNWTVTDLKAKLLLTLCNSRLTNHAIKWTILLPHRPRR